MPADDDRLRQAVLAASHHQAALDELEALLRRADERIAQRCPVCLGGGACCRFDLTGNRLYVSTLELALLIRQAPPHPDRAGQHRCPYQAGPRCLARGRRPLGCRTYYCRAPVDWMNEVYEDVHRQVRELHERHGVEYFYVEMTAAVAHAAAPARGEDAGRPGSGKNA